jgi:hypothetical protein
MLVRPGGILGSAGRSDFVVWMMLSMFVVVRRKVESRESTQIREHNAEEESSRSFSNQTLT